MKRIIVLFYGLCIALSTMLAEGANIGERKALCIFLGFSNINLRSANITAWEKQLNGVDYVPNKGVGSVHDYFFDMSYGQFSLTFDCLPYRVSGVRSDYAATNSSGNSSKFVPALEEALKGLYESGQLTDEMIARYDWDNDGEVDQIVVIYAGLAGQNSNSTGYIRSHESTMAGVGKALTLGGKRFNTYAACAETRSDNRTIDGIGGVVHEIIHCFGLPDFYGPYSSQQSSCYTGMDGFWDVMDIGTYNGDNYNGTIPPQMTAFERWKAGWLTPIELTTTQDITGMPLLIDEPVAYIIYNTASANASDNLFCIPQGMKRKECIIIENRCSTASYHSNGRQWDKPIGQHSGLLVVHVDYNENAWNATAPNQTPSRQRMTIVPADGNLTGAWKNYLDASVPADVWHEGSISTLPFYTKTTQTTAIRNISIAANATASFHFEGQTADGMLAPSTSHGTSVENGEQAPTYDLLGRRVTGTARPGIVVRNGKKVAYKSKR